MSDIHARTSAAFLADAKARCDAAAAQPVEPGAADAALAALSAALDAGLAAEAARRDRLEAEGYAFTYVAGLWYWGEACHGFESLTDCMDDAESPAMVPQQAQQQQGQSASVYIETRTLGGDVIRRHGPFARDSRPYRDTWHAEHCACEGHNRSRRHDDRSAQRVHVVDAAAR